MAGPGRDHMLKAARIIARDARRRAKPWSVQIPPSIQVAATDSEALIVTGVGPAYPNEIIRVRHPVFGFGQTGNAWSATHRPRPKWVTNAHRPFLFPAADAKADAAADEIAKSIDDLCHNLGYK